MGKYDFKFLTELEFEDLVRFEVEARDTEKDVFIHPFDENIYRESLRKEYQKRDEHTVILAYADNKVIGRIDCMFYTSLMDYYKNGYIDWIYVLKEYRSQGIGKMLIQEAEKHFKNNHVCEYYLFTASNKEAQHFYHKQDFKFENREVATKEL